MSNFSTAPSGDAAGRKTSSFSTIARNVANYCDRTCKFSSKTVMSSFAATFYEMPPFCANIVLKNETFQTSSNQTEADCKSNRAKIHFHKKPKCGNRFIFAKYWTKKQEGGPMNNVKTHLEHRCEEWGKQRTLVLLNLVFLLNIATRSSTLTWDTGYLLCITLFILWMLLSF